LKPQLEQRQTACMRYISAWHRSQSTLSASQPPGRLAVLDWRLLMAVMRRADGGGDVGSDIAAIIAQPFVEAVHDDEAHGGPKCTDG
jgi:hypothetical protein